MRYILDDNGYVSICSDNNIVCGGKECTEYTGAIPEGYDSLEDWVQNANIRAYHIVNGNLTLDEYEDEYLKMEYELETLAGLVGKSLVQMTLNTNITDFNTSYKHFFPFGASGNNTVIDVGKKIQYGYITGVDYGDRTNQTVYGVQVGAGVPYVKVSPTIRYLNNNTSVANVTTYIDVIRDGTVTTRKIIADTVPASARHTVSFSYLLNDLKENDFIFIHSWSNKTDIDVISSDNETSVLFETLY